MEKESLEKLFKQYESANESRISPYDHFIVRLDGKKFSTFTKAMKKGLRKEIGSPFHDLLVDTMIATSKDLLEEFRPATAYTHSDEISLIFPAVEEEEEAKDKENKDKENKDKENKDEENKVHLYNGRICKIVSLTAAYGSVRFNFHLSCLLRSPKYLDMYSCTFLAKTVERQQYFDARILVFPPSHRGDIVKHMVWRSLTDCPRNAVSTYARFFFGHQKINGKNTTEMIAMMHKEKNFIWDRDVPLYLRHGTYVKKEKYPLRAQDRKTGQDIITWRTQLVSRNVILEGGDEDLRLLLAKYWES